MDTKTAVALITNPPPLLLEELVLSAEPIEEVFNRHNVPAELHNLVYTHPAFTSKLAATKAHHEKTGEYHRSVARYNFLAALENAHLKAMDTRTSPKDAIAWVETLSSIGGIKQSAQAVEAGGGFVFNINFTDGKSVTVEAKNEPAVIEGEVVNSMDELPVVSIASQDEPIYEFTE